MNTAGLFDTKSQYYCSGLKCLCKVSYVLRWGFWKGIGPERHCTHQWTYPLMNLQPNVLLGGWAWLEVVNHWRCDLAGGWILIPGSSLSFCFLYALRRVAFFHHTLLPFCFCHGASLLQTEHTEIVSQNKSLSCRYWTFVSATGKWLVHIDFIFI